jgi:hypothetical protein
MREVTDCGEFFKWRKIVLRPTPIMRLPRNAIHGHINDFLVRTGLTAV